MMAGPPADGVTVTLHGYFSREYSGNRRSFTVPFTEDATPRTILTHLAVPLGAVGLLLVNKRQTTMDSELHAGDALDVLPLLGGG
jgi:hypothetical protein